MVCNGRIRGIRKTEFPHTCPALILGSDSVLTFREKTVCQDLLNLFTGQLGLDSTTDQLASPPQNGNRIGSSALFLKEIVPLAARQP